MGARRVASADTSVLILLAKAGHLPLLRAAFDVVLVDGTVAQAALQGAPARPDAQAIAAALDGGLLTRARPDPPRVRQLAKRHPSLGPGERGAIALADPVVLLDDWPARRIAAVEGCKPVGTLGVIARAHRVGALKRKEDIRDALRDVLNAGLWVDATVVERFWRELGP